MKRMEEKGIKTPPSRESIFMNELAGGLFETAEAFKTRTNVVASLEEMGRDLYIDEEGIPWGPDAEKVRKYKLQASSLRSAAKKHALMRTLIKDHEAIVALEKAVSDKSQSDDDLASIKEDLARRSSSWNELVADNLSSKNEQEFNAWLDNTRAFHDQLLIWDRREFEPLRVRADEFYPPKEMALFDLQPISQWSILRDEYPQNDEILEFILAQLNLLSSQSVKRVLTSLWPGAFEWMSEHCPSLTDPNKGGWRDLDKLSVRRMSSEMYREILEAWVEWPWRPTRWEIMAKLGSEHYDPDSVETDD